METLITAIDKDRENRIEVVKKPIIHMLTGDATELLPPGSGVVIVANSGSILFDELDKALKSKDTEQINKIVNQNKRLASGLTKVSSRKALTTLINAPFQIDVSYDTKTIAVNLFTVKGIELIRTLFAFSGGEFDADEFKYTEFSKSETTADAKVMVVMHQPRLSRLELQAVKIPKEMSVMHFGGVSGETLQSSAALAALFTAGAFIAAAASATGGCKSHFENIGDAINPVIKAGKLLGVKELVRARQDAINNKKLMP
jgi:hypothetical protein